MHLVYPCSKFYYDLQNSLPLYFQMNVLRETFQRRASAHYIEGNISERIFKRKDLLLYLERIYISDASPPAKYPSRIKYNYYYQKSNRDLFYQVHMIKNASPHCGSFRCFLSFKETPIIEILAETTLPTNRIR